MSETTDKIIEEGINKVYLNTIRSIVEWLKKYPVQDVIAALENELAEKEAKQ